MIAKVLFDLLPAFLGQQLGSPFDEPGRVTIRRSAVVHEIPELPHIVLTPAKPRDTDYGQRAGPRMLGEDAEAGTCFLQDEAQRLMVLPVEVRLVHNHLRQAMDQAKAMNLALTDAVLGTVADDGREFTFPVIVIQPIGLDQLRPNIGDLIEVIGQIEIEDVPELLPGQADAALMTEITATIEEDQDGQT